MCNSGPELGWSCRFSVGLWSMTLLQSLTSPSGPQSCEREQSPKLLFELGLVCHFSVSTSWAMLLLLTIWLSAPLVRELEQRRWFLNDHGRI